MAEEVIYNGRNRKKPTPEISRLISSSEDYGSMYTNKHTDNNIFDKHK